MTAYVRVETPVGTVTLVGSDDGLSRLLWEHESPPVDARERTSPVLETAARQLREYFAGERRVFELPLDLAGTPFQRRAWLALQAIPFGTTVTYGEQARRLGNPRAARAVGAANGRNPIAIVLPCHRLVGVGGALTGFGGGLQVKRALLEHERRVAGTKEERGLVDRTR